MKIIKLMICCLMCILLLAGCGPAREDETNLQQNSEPAQDNTIQDDHKTVVEDTPSNNPSSVRGRVIQNKSIRRAQIRENMIKRRIGNIKPIKRMIVGDDFQIADIKDTDLDVNDPGAKSQWAAVDTKSYTLWNQIQQDETIKIAIVDTGIDYNHVDLTNRVAVDEGYDFINDDKDPMDDNGHGTHVAGIIAAEMNNNEGITGIVGNLDVSLLPIKVLDSEGQGDPSVVADGILYAAEQGVHIINLSLGGGDEDQDIMEAIRYAMDQGILVIAAAGNDTANCDNYMPAGMDGVYTVAASNLLHRGARFSNYGESVDVAAPGVKILSTVPGNGYEAWDGTSMAAPIVTGIAAMLLAEEPSLTPSEIANILSASTTDILSEGKDVYSGYGLVNAEEAYNLLTYLH